MNMISAARSALVLVDYQERLMAAIHGGERVVAEARFLAAVARELGLRVFGTEQNPAGLGPNLPSIRAACERTIEKMHFDACEDGLLGALTDAGVTREVVVAGCEAHVCLLQTALGLIRGGYRTWIVASACGSRAPADHALAMQRLQHAGAVIVSAEMVAFEWLGSCDHPRFRAVLGLLKARPPAASA